MTTPASARHPSLRVAFTQRKEQSDVAFTSRPGSRTRSVLKIAKRQPSIKKELVPKAALNVAYLFDPSRDSGPIPYHLQGDPEMNKPEKLLQRAALKHHPNVKAAVEKMRDLFTPDEDGCILRDDYLMVHARISRALLPRVSQKVEEVAEEDWEFDCRGKDRLSPQDFYEAMFTLVDLWTVSAEAEEYIAFCEALIERVQYPHVTSTDPYGLLGRNARAM